MICLVPGFPRKLDQGLHFERTVSMPILVLRLSCPNNVLRQRLPKRDSDRTDDVSKKIEKRMKAFEVVTGPVLER